MLTFSKPISPVIHNKIPSAKATTATKATKFAIMFKISGIA
jgi:hypothetical protein